MIKAHEARKIALTKLEESRQVKVERELSLIFNNIENASNLGEFVSVFNTNKLYNENKKILNECGYDVNTSGPSCKAAVYVKW